MVTNKGNPEINKNMVATHLHRRLEQARIKHLELNKARFCKKIGITRETYRNWEVGKTHPVTYSAECALQLVPDLGETPEKWLRDLHKQFGMEYVSALGAGEPNISNPDEHDGQNSRGGPSQFQIAAVAIVGAILVAILLRQSFNEPDAAKPTNLPQNTVWADCVPRAGKVHFRFSSENTAHLALACPDTGRVDTGLPAADARKISDVYQDIRSDERLNMSLASLSDGEAFYQAEHSPTMVLWERRWMLVSRICPEGANRMTITGVDTEPTIFCDTNEAASVNVPFPKDAQVEVEFFANDSLLSQCNAVFEPVMKQPVDLTDPAICSADHEKTPLPTTVPLLPFWAAADTFLDEASGTTWMRDLYRYGPTKAWGIPLDLDQLLLQVRADTGEAEWQIANASDLRALKNFSQFRGGLSSSSDALEGFAFDDKASCPPPGLVRFSISATSRTPAPSDRFGFLKCATQLGEYGFWLIKKER